jgi:hypothetical protein
MNRSKRIKVFEIMHFIIAMILVSVVSLSIESCNKNENQDEKLNNESEEVQYVPNRTNVQQLLAIAVDKSFENSFNQQPSTKGFVSDQGRYQLVAETDNPLHVSYPYDYIKIYDAVKFSCDGVISPVVEEICGNGKLEVYIASFALFNGLEEKEAEEEKEAKEKTADVNSSNVDGDLLDKVMMGEPMIVFKSELGIYSCISNGTGVVDQTTDMNNNYIEFSSHKYLSDKALEKNLVYPLFQFRMRYMDGKVTLRTTGWDGTLTIYADNIPLYNQQTVSPKELFSLVKLSSNIPEISLQCEVTELHENYFTVKTGNESNLETVYYDEYTGFFVGGNSATYADIAVGDVIDVTFGKLYESYNPKSIIANKIIK